MSNIIKEFPLLYLYDYIEEEKKLVDLDFQPLIFNSQLTEQLAELYKKIIEALDNFYNQRKTISKQTLIKIKNLSTDDNSLFKIEQLIFQDSIILYVPNAATIIKGNKYFRTSDIRTSKGELITIPNYTSWSKIIASVAYIDIQHANIRNSIYNYNNIMDGGVSFKKSNFIDLDIKIKSLNINKNNIHDYNYINEFIELESLKITNKNYNLNKLELNLPNLRTLIVTNHSSKVKLPEDLLALNIRGNEFQSITLVTSNLSELNFSGCNLVSFDFILPETVDELNLSYNNLKCLKLSSPNLIEVRANSNQITKLELVGLKNILGLDLSENLLQNITLGAIDQISVKNIQYLRLEHNHINSCMFLDTLYESSLREPKNQRINLSYNELTSIEGIVDHMPYLTDLDVSYNRIKEIPSILFPNNLRIKNFNISYNMIKKELSNKCISHLSKSFHHKFTNSFDYSINTDISGYRGMDYYID